MRIPSKRAKRRGASLVESVISFTVFVALAFGMVDLAHGVFLYNAVSEASRQGARIAAVHGTLATVDGSGTMWGPTADTGAAGNSTTDPIVVAIRNAGALAGLNPANVTISVSWPTGGNSVQNKPGDTVQVTVSTTWTPVFGFILGSSTRTLSATSIEPIAH